MRNIEENVLFDFVSRRPQTVGTFFYGSAIFKQESYSDESKPQVDVIFVVEDLKSWHRNNMEINSTDYSLAGRLHISCASVERLKGHNNITYLSNIKEGKYKFKYGVTEITDFVNGLYTWSPFFVAGRLHKPILTVKSNQSLDEAILRNRESALLVASLFCDEFTTMEVLLTNVCGLSYFGTPRMEVAENPHKIENIVNGSYDALASIYRGKRDYIFFDGNEVYIDREKQFRHISELPKDLLEYFEKHRVDVNNLDSIRMGIYSFLIEHNRAEELAQIFEGFKTNGILRSVPYISAKLAKKFKG